MRHQDHWLQAFTLMPRASAAGNIAAPAQEMALRTHHNDETIWFDFGASDNAASELVAGERDEVGERVADGSGKATQVRFHDGEQQQHPHTSSVGEGCTSPAPPLPAGNGSGLYELFDAERIVQLNDADRNGR
jgi:hypothetical protein